MDINWNDLVSDYFDYRIGTHTAGSAAPVVQHELQAKSGVGMETVVLMAAVALVGVLVLKN